MPVKQENDILAFIPWKTREDIMEEEGAANRPIDVSSASGADSQKRSPGSLEFPKPSY